MKVLTKIAFFLIILSGCSDKSEIREKRVEFLKLDDGEYVIANGRDAVSLSLASGNQLYYKLEGEEKSIDGSFSTTKAGKYTFYTRDKDIVVKGTVTAIPNNINIVTSVDINNVKLPKLRGLPKIESYNIDFFLGRNILSTSDVDDLERASLDSGVGTGAESDSSSDSGREDFFDEFHKSISQEEFRRIFSKLKSDNGISNTSFKLLCRGHAIGEVTVYFVNVSLKLESGVTKNIDDRDTLIVSKGQKIEFSATNLNKEDIYLRQNDYVLDLDGKLSKGVYRSCQFCILKDEVFIPIQTLDLVVLPSTHLDDNCYLGEYEHGEVIVIEDMLGFDIRERRDETFKNTFIFKRERDKILLAPLHSVRGKKELTVTYENVEVYKISFDVNGYRDGDLNSGVTLQNCGNTCFIDSSIIAFLRASGRGINIDTNSREIERLIKFMFSAINLGNKGALYYFPREIQAIFREKYSEGDIARTRLVKSKRDNNFLGSVKQQDTNEFALELHNLLDTTNTFKDISMPTRRVKTYGEYVLFDGVEEPVSPLYVELENSNQEFNAQQLIDNILLPQTENIEVSFIESVKQKIRNGDWECVVDRNDWPLYLNLFERSLMFANNENKLVILNDNVFVTDMDVNSIKFNRPKDSNYSQMVEINNMTYLAEGEIVFVPLKDNLEVIKNPKILSLVLKRYEFVAGKANKINTKVLLDKSVVFNNEEYELVSYVVHKGTSSGGHYIAYVKSEDDAWFEHNDIGASVERVDNPPHTKYDSGIYTAYYHKIEAE